MEQKHVKINVSSDYHILVWYLRVALQITLPKINVSFTNFLHTGLPPSLYGGRKTRENRSSHNSRILRMKKYVENMKKYVALGTRRARCESSCILFFLYKDPGTWNNSELFLGSETSKIASFIPCTLYKLWNLKERSEVRVVVYCFLSMWRPWYSEKWRKLFHSF